MGSVEDRLVVALYTERGIYFAQNFFSYHSADMYT